MENSKDERTWSVYMHISPEIMIYIGVTCMKPKMRWANGHGYYGNKEFKEDILKFGWLNFQHIIVEEGLTRIAAFKMERQLIKDYKTNDKNYGYNHTDGGDGGILHMTESHRNALIEHNSIPIYQFDKDYNFIAEYRGAHEAARILSFLSSSGITQCCKLNKEYIYDYIWRYKDEVKDPYNKDCIPKYPENKRKYNKSLYQIDIQNRTYLTWENANIAAQETGYKPNSILQACSGKAKTLDGYIWKYCIDVKDIDKFVMSDEIYKYISRNAILQCDNDWNVVNCHQSATKAGELLGLDRKMIALACKGRLEEYGGYKWKYA